MKRSSEGKKFKAKRRELVSYLRKNSSCLESLSPTEVLNKFVSVDDHLRTRLTQSLLSIGWLKKDLNSLLSFADAELGTKLAVNAHNEKFGRTCPVCHKNYARIDRVSQNKLVRTFGVCILCLAKGSDNATGSSSQALAKILVSAATNGFLLNGRNSFIRMIDDNDALTLHAIERLAELFAQYSDAVSSVEIKESALSMLQDLKQKEEKRAKHEQNRLTELAQAIAALGMVIDYDILDGTVYGKTYVIKIWIEGYGTTIVEGDKNYIVRTLSNLESKITKARFKCPACEEEFRIDRNLLGLTICRCGTRFRFAQVRSSMYEGVNPQAAFDPWPWLVAGIKARIQKSSEMDIYFNLLHYGISVEDLFDGVYVTDVPFSDFPCYAISTFIRPKSFENLSPDARHHLALAIRDIKT